MKKAYILLLSSLLALSANAQDKFVVCKHCIANTNLKTFHQYAKADIDSAIVDAEDSIVVYTKSSRHSYHRNSVDSIRFARPLDFEDTGAEATNKVFINETFASSLGSFFAETPKGTAWAYSSTYKCAIATGYNSGTTTPSEGYLVSVEMDMSNVTAATLSFNYLMNYKGSTHKVLITDCYTGDVSTTEWTTLVDNSELVNPMSFNTTKRISKSIPSRFLGESNVTIALYYSCESSSSTWEVKNLVLSDATPSQGGDVTPGGTDPDNLNKNDVSASSNKEVWRLEFPKIKGDDMNLVITHSTDDYGITYSLEWDCNKRANRWTCYEMYKSNSVKNVKRNDAFAVDPDIPTQYQSTLADYSGSGYSRGHLCPSADRLCSREQNQQTFYLSNMQPQISGHNSGVWSTLEQKLRDKWNLDSNRDTLYVVKGATIDDDNILTYTSSGLIVPKYFYMALLIVKDGEYKAMGVWSPHETDSTTEYISIDELEQRTGIDFFCNLPDAIEKEVEATCNTSQWN